MTARQIAEKLTEAQFKALIMHNPKYGARATGWPGSTREPLSFAQSGRQLMDMKLIAWTSDPRSSETVITPLGLAVRAILLSKGQEHE